MSEDSDYTSDINYPVRHQYNTSAHQVPREQRYGTTTRHDSRDSQDFYSAPDYYEDSFDRGPSLDRGPSFDQWDGEYDRGQPLHHEQSYDQEYDEPGYERERDYYMYQENSSPYHNAGYGDTDSEPMFYNSQPYNRPESFNVDRWVCGWLWSGTLLGLFTVSLSRPLTLHAAAGRAVFKNHSKLSNFTSAITRPFSGHHMWLVWKLLWCTVSRLGGVEDGEWWLRWSERFLWYFWMLVDISYHYWLSQVNKLVHDKSFNL